MNSQEIRINGQWSYFNSITNQGEIEISIEDLAKQLTRKDIDDLITCHQYSGGKYGKTQPQKEECRCFDWKGTLAEKEGNRYCPKCLKSIPKPLPDKGGEIEELGIDLYLNGLQMRDVIMKINELIRRYNEDRRGR